MIRLLVLFGLALIISAQDDCLLPFVQVGSECYYFSITTPESRSWDSARQDCQIRGGDLAVMQQDCEQDKSLIDYIISNDWTSSMFVGVTDEANEGLWIWIDGRASDLRDSLWRYQEPSVSSSYDCGLLDYYIYDFPRVHLIDYSCSSSAYYICQLGVHSKK